jgi:hypothetical protein
VTGLAEALAVDKATATDLLDQMYRAQLIGPPKRGRSREVLFSPDEVDRALSTLAKPDDDAALSALAEERIADDNGNRHDLADVIAEDEDPDAIREAFDQGPHGVTKAPDEWRDSDGNPWPTSPFSDS